MLGCGLAIRLVLAFATYGVQFDVDSLALARDQLAADPLHLYAALTVQVGDHFSPRWPYPPGFFAWIAPAGWLADHTGLPFHGLIQIPAILADLALAWLVQAYLGMRGAADRTRLAAAALIALGPSFIAISGYHGQLDSVAILPAVAALVLWERGGRARAWAAGLLIGVGAAIKTVPILVALALLPTARSLREGTILAGAAALVPVALMAPFVLADPGAVDTVSGYHGAPGVGGISLLVQPDLATLWLSGHAVELTPASRWLFDHGSVLTIIGLATAAVFLMRYRPSPARAAVVVWLVVYAASPNFFLQYAVWGLPFFLLAGYLWQVAAAQAVLLVPTLLVYLAPVSTGLALGVYAPLMIGLWVAVVVCLVRTCRSIARESDLRDLGGRGELAHANAR